MSTNPPLQGELLRETQLELVSSTTSAGTLYGIAFVLYCLYLHASLPLPMDHGRRRQAQFMITYSTIIMVCGLYYLVANAWVLQDAYISHYDFPGGPLIYEQSSFRTQPVIAVGTVCETAVDILTAAIQIWRLWVVWSSTRYYARLVIVLPVLSLLGFAATQITLIVFNVTLTHKISIGNGAIHLAMAGFVLRATTTIFPTVMIAGYLIFQNRRQKKLMGKLHMSNPYMSIIAMLVESYVLESAWMIVLVILYVDFTVQQFFGDTLLYIETIAYLLVLYRVANGRSYGSKAVPEPASRHEHMSSLHWNHTTNTQSDVTSVNDGLSRIRPEPNTLQERGSPV